MDFYSPLLEKTRVPQPSLQKFAVISIFSKLRSAPTQIGPESEPGREAISFCLTSHSPAVVDQSVRELCRLVLDSVLDVSRGLLELQSALDGSGPQFVSLFVKGLGFLVRIGYGRKNGNWNFNSIDSHPFVKILLCRAEVQTELLHQVLLFIMHNKPLGLVEVCEFLKPFLYFSILRVPLSDSASSLFIRQLVSSMASLCCSFGNEAIPVFSLLMSCLMYVPCKNLEEVRDFNFFLESLVDAYTVVLRDLVGTGLLLTEFQLLGVELVDTVLSFCASPLVQQKVGKEPEVEQVKHLLAVQKDLGLRYVPELSSSVLSLFVILVKSDLEHEQLSILKFLQFLLTWKSENENIPCGDAVYPSEELLLVFPIINLMSSPSKSVKGVANDLLSILEKVLLNLMSAPKAELAIKEGYASVSKPGSIVFRLMQQLWFQDHHSSSSPVVVHLAFTGGNKIENLQQGPRFWPSLLIEYSKRVFERRKSSASVFQSQEVPLLLGAVGGLLVMHPLFISDGIDSLAAVGVMDSKMGVPLLLSVLFYSNLLTQKDVIFQNALPKLLGLLPSLASQSVMIPLVVQTIMSMLRKDVKPVLCATAIRLLCQTWEINDRAFSSLQGVILPKGFINFISERHICISMAASIRDVCKKNPDRGVDLILSVQACIESQDCTIQSLGFQGLSHLCEADVIDFYTAWNVIEKHVHNFCADPILAHSLCLLLRWGAIDAAAYPEDSVTVLKILWQVASFENLVHSSQWTKARVSAVQALAQYEVSHIEKSIPELIKDAAELLFSETNAEMLKALEDLHIKIMIHEHTFRRRHVKEKKVLRSKIEKLLDVIPQAMFPSGKGRNAGEVPGAALFCLSFNSRNTNYGASRGLRDVNAQYEDALRELTVSLQLSRNIIVALISLQSMKSYMRRWMRDNILSIDASARDIASDKTSKAASVILKSMIQMAEESFPSSAENIALALGALCAVLPSSVHTIKATASKFLLGWLFQHEHEHRQWTAALSLGLISSSLHVTDHKQRFQNISGLLEVLSCSKRSLVKGACGVGLGFSCQDLLTRIEAMTDTSSIDTEFNSNQEESLLGRIVRALASTLCQVDITSSNILESLSVEFPASTEDNMTNIYRLSLENFDGEFDDDVWGIAGLVIGLGMCVAAIYRAGRKDTVMKIKDLITSWVPHADSLILNASPSGESSQIALSVGSCLALPTVVAFCQKVELFDVNEVDYLMTIYRELISGLLSVKKSGAFHKSFLMASCIGAGSVLACLLNEEIYPVEVESIKSLLELFRKCYSGSYPPIIHFGGMLGVINALGAGAGNLTHAHSFPLASPISSEEKGISYVSGPLLSSSFFSQHLTPFVQEIFLIAQNSEDHHLQQYAAWAISFLRNYMWSKGQLSLNNDIQADAAHPKPVSDSVSEDSMVMKLALWLKHLNFSGTNGSLNISTVASVLRCLSHAPRLPNLDWGAMVRRCMRHEAQITASLLPDSSSNNKAIREECLLFSLAHASRLNELLTFVDELSDFSRFNTLEFNLQSCLLHHLADLIRIFSGSRIEKLFVDISRFIDSLSLNQEYGSDEKSMLLGSCWKGLYHCLDETSLDSHEYISKIEKCMELLFAFLPLSQSASIISMRTKEWSAAVSCLGRSRRDWLDDFLLVTQLDPINRNVQFCEDLKKIQAKAKLARVGSIPFTELGRIKAIILNCKSLGIWDVLIEVVAALQNADGSVRRQWLVDAIEISCVSDYPSTALLFVGLLSGSCCEYMPFLTADQSTVLNDLPVTLTSLLADPGWEIIAETLISYLWSSTERIYGFVTGQAAPGVDDTLSTQTIDASEKDKAPFLLEVMHHVCVSFKEHLPLDKQLRLASMVWSSPDSAGLQRR